MSSKRVLDLKLKSLKAKINRLKQKNKTKNIEFLYPSPVPLSSKNDSAESLFNSTVHGYNENKIIDDHIHESDKVDYDNDLSEEDCEDHIFIEGQDPNEVKNFLATWSVRHNSSHRSINELLVFFKKYFPELPKDARTLLKTPKVNCIIDMEPGEYVHIGLKRGLDRVLDHQSILPTEITLTFNIDGLPLSRSSSSCFWPILCKPNITNKILVVGVYHGYSQPKNFNNFLRLFVDELKELMTEYKFKNTLIKIRIHLFILDAVARAHVLCIKSHCGYFACNRCTQEGEFHGGVTFPGIHAPKRTNESFRNQDDDEYHHGKTILEELDLDLVNQFSLDYLHLALLGVMKKL